jgi:hypothetical protein
MPPKGRIRKPTANTAKLASSEAVGLSAGKNRCPSVTAK